MRDPLLVELRYVFNFFKLNFNFLNFYLQDTFFGIWYGRSMAFQLFLPIYMISLYKIDIIISSYAWL